MARFTSAFLIPAWAWLPAAALAGAAMFSLTPLHSSMSHAVDDLHQRVFARQQVFEASLVVDIDDASLRKLQPIVGPWPFKRDLYALVADYLKELGASAVVFDIVFAGPREGDDALNASVKRGTVVLAASALTRLMEIDPAEQTLMRRAAWPVEAGVPAVSWAALVLPSQHLWPPGEFAALGVFTVSADEDGVLRNLPLLHRVDGHYFPALWLAAHFATQGVAAPSVQSLKGRMRIGPIEVPVDGQGRVKLLFPRNALDMPTWSFQHVAKAALGLGEVEGLRRAVAGRTVFIGSSAYFADAALTPIGQMTGISLVALTFEELRRGRFLKPRGTLWDLAMLGLALATVAASALSGASGRWRIAALGASAMAGMVVLDAGLHLVAMQQVELVLPMVALLAGLALSAVRNSRRGVANADST